METNQMSIMMLPWLAHGHISPFLDLAKKLSTKNITTYICSTSINLNSIKPKIPENSFIKLIDINLESSELLPPHFHTTKNLPLHLMVTLKTAFDNSSLNFSNILNNIKPDILIYDFLMPWAPQIASSHNIPAVEFIVCSASFTAFLQHLYMLKNHDFPFPEIFLRNYDKLKYEEFTHPSQDRGQIDTLPFAKCLELSKDIVLIKTFRQVEGKYVDYLSSLIKKKVIPVPLVEDVKGNELPIMEWLNKKKQGSSVFVAFGTEYYLTKNEIGELAHGLDLSGLNFIWVLKFPYGDDRKLEDVLPEGFLERIKEKAMVILDWAPQMEILKHESVGGFVCHCGWSSIMEAMKVGVPIIGIPMHLDQPVNARLAVEAGICLEVLRNDDGLIEREMVADAIKRVVIDEDGISLRKKAKELSENLGLINDDEEFNGLAEELVKLCLS
ncbi:UDP-glucosyltransferase 29-like [Impatiens glandulifera]|uniref:UDP-glucosyltransferase 29-like n=1 Tax=Impatiens glandulifera TaxID=253017 RepID=UPI001FB18618|nr:UDP-glucosyltransferase 29-like [Impatiens glandulifera]